MSLQQKKWVETFPITREEAWRFFSRPENLSLITPPSMKFQIVRLPEGEMYEGMFIEYRVSPFPGIRVPWVTEITKIQDKRYFIDEQRLGPYRIWHHEHHFREVDGGVEMTDLLSYQLPVPLIRSFIGPLLVDKKVDSIFAYRKEVLEKRFGTIRR